MNEWILDNLFQIISTVAVGAGVFFAFKYDVKDGKKQMTAMEGSIQKIGIDVKTLDEKIDTKVSEVYAEVSKNDDKFSDKVDELTKVIHANQIESMKANAAILEAVNEKKK